MLRKLTLTTCWMKACLMIYANARKCTTMKRSRNLFWKVRQTSNSKERFYLIPACLFMDVVSEKGKNHFEVLPEGWLQVTHNSGLPIYMHKASRVCSVSRPYFLGPGSLRVWKTFFLHPIRFFRLYVEIQKNNNSKCC